MRYYVGIDIGGTYIKYGLVDETGKLHDDNQIVTVTRRNEIIDRLVEIVINYQKNYQITGVGVSCPGIIRDDGYMMTGGSIMAFYGINLKKILSERLGLEVAVENDANCAALAEKWQGAGKDYSSSLTVVVGTGIGGGIIINDRLFRGAHATAGEFGFMLVDPIQNGDTRLSTLSLTGSVGCGVVDKYNGINQSDQSDQLSGIEVFKQAEQGNTLALRVIEDFYDRLAIGIFNMATAFDPEVILIGGAISSDQVFMSTLIDRVRAIKNGHRDMSAVVLPEIKPCYYLNKAGIIGAVYQFMM
ncbi:ROK family protein [Amphibacillus sp. Q70]|uniref:ROK family protein n=1 Tax=Amphibacillus sp. Q70 TaxID=3453416 RepID=UPI003F82E7E3